MDTRINAEHAADLAGRSVLIQLEILNGGEQPVGTRQMYGRIEKVSETEGICVRLQPSGEMYALPLEPDDFHPATPGFYTLDPGGEVIENPELFFHCQIHEPPPEMDVPPVQDLPGNDPRIERSIPAKES